MECQEPRFDKGMTGVRFRPPSYRGPSPADTSTSDGFIWEIGAAVGGGFMVVQK